jgi:hypothetical protein
MFEISILIIAITTYSFIGLIGLIGFLEIAISDLDHEEYGIKVKSSRKAHGDE